MNISKNVSIFLILTTIFLIFPNFDARAETPRKARWTMIFFLSGDNIMEAYCEKDVTEMKKIGSTPEVNIVVLQDHERKPAQKLYIKKGSADILDEYKKIDTGDHKELVKFVKWAIEKYPADHYMIGLWQHGGMWHHRGGNLIPLRICYDDGSANNITASELGEALKQIKDFSGKNIDILGMDCNLSQTMENCYEVRELADFIVSSEENVPSNGWPYDLILEGITKNPHMKPDALAAFIVNAVHEKYSKGSESVTQSAIDCSKLNETVKKLDAMADVLIEKLEDEKIKAALNQGAASVHTYAVDDYCDLVHFCRLLKSGVKDEKIVKAAGEVIDSVTSGPLKLVIENKTSNESVKYSEGISIYLPKSRVSAKYGNNDFGKPRWTDFIKKYRK